MSSQQAQTRAEHSEPDGEALVQVRGLKTYYESASLLGGAPVKAVDGVSFDIHEGETLGLVGESGCGKTTLGRTMIQLEQATDGTIAYAGTDITELESHDLKEWRSNVQIVFQDPDSSLNGRMTVGEIIREPLDVHNWKTPRERKTRVRELLETVGLREEHYYRYPHQFSGGQRQRIGVARALALNPDFVVLDEPVSALDASVQAKILNLLEDLQEEFGLTYLFIAHDLAVVRHICDRVAVMYLGKIMELGPTEELFEDPQNPYTRSLLSAIPEPDPTLEKSRITLHGTPPSPRDPPSGCSFSTRCPMKIRPADQTEAPPEVWAAVEIFREVVRERSRAQKTLSERVRERLGMHTRFATVDEITSDLFGDLDVPTPIQTVIDDAAGYMEAGAEQEARTLLREEFGSICDQELPEDHVVSDTGRTSHCHRHLAEFDDPADAEAEVLGTR